MQAAPGASSLTLVRQGPGLMVNDKTGLITSVLFFFKISLKNLELI